jgi:hypothetical protein
MKAKVINIKIRAGELGYFHATSPDMPGLHVTEKGRDALLGEIPNVIAALAKAQGKDVVAHELEAREGDDPAWVIVPKAERQRA